MAEAEGLPDHLDYETQCKISTAHSGEMISRSAQYKGHTNKRYKKIHKCEHCEYKTARLDSMKAHMRKHSGDMLECEHCEYKTAHKSSLKRHLLKHNTNTGGTGL